MAIVNLATPAITDVVGAHLHKRTGHTAESLLESRLLMTHNDPIEHWKGNHGDKHVNPHFPGSDRIDRIKIAIDNFYENKEAYISNQPNINFDSQHKILIQTC